MFDQRAHHESMFGVSSALPSAWRWCRSAAGKNLLCCREVAFGLLGVFAVALPIEPMDAAAAPPPSYEPEAGRAGSEGIPARLSYFTGEVSFWRPGAEDWSPAELNTPLSPGDALYTGADGNVEVQIGGQAFLRAAPETQLGITNRELDFDQIEVRSGRSALDVRALSPGETIEIDTPQAAFTIDGPGYYRIDVSDSDTTFAAHRGGRARIATLAGATSSIGTGQQVVVYGGGEGQMATAAAAELDAWDRWNYDRTSYLVESASSRYVSPEVYGLDDLDRYGTWRTDNQYGPVWYPSSVAADWSPYSVGRWIYDPYYGWSWVDAAPWGWAPSHYGRWVRVSGYWGWAPGPVVAAPVYAPAVVAFFGGHNFSIGIGIGAPAVGWLPLGWGEPIVPWWGGVGFVGVPWWGGWGGPWVINNIVIHDHHHHHRAHDIRNYCHSRERRALRFDREDRFGRGRPDRRHDWREVRQNNLQPVHGRLRARPTAASLSPGEGRGVRPPDRVRQRQVVATRAGRDNTERLRQAGLRVPDRDRSTQRIVGSRDPGRVPAATETRQRPSLRTRDRELGAVDQRGRDPRSQPNREGNVRQRPNARDRANAPERANIPPPPNARGRASVPQQSNAPDRMRQRRPEIPVNERGRSSVERRQSANPRAQRPVPPPVPRADRPGLQQRPHAAPEVNQGNRRERANVGSQRPARSSPERARPSRPDVQSNPNVPARPQTQPRPNAQMPRSQQPARRERPHGSASQLQRQQRSAGRDAIAPRQMPASQPRQMRERAHAPAQQPRVGGPSASSSGGARRGGETRGAPRGSSSAPAQRGSSPQRNSHGNL
jgi:hypothetical protein